jgi:flagellar biosynthesis protein FlhB
MSDSDKTEKPTPKKIKEARRNGQVARTPDIGAWTTVLAAAFMLKFTMQSSIPRLQGLFEQIGNVIHRPTDAGAVAILASGGRTMAALLVPLCLVLALAALVGSASQGGVHLATKSFKPKLSRLNPLQGFKRILGPQAAWESIKSTLKTGLAAWIAYRALMALVPLLTSSGAMPLSAVLHMVAGTAMRLMRDVAFAGLGMGLADYVYQYRRVAKQLRMTKHEVKQEYKQSEGDPQLKSAIRSRQLAMSRNRMMSQVALADVVVVNPTHVAVALRYQPDRGAPRVVAKGAGVIAARIREEAEKHRVPMVADIALARALNATCDLDQEIPGELFSAVAQVLAFVLSLRAKGSAAGTHHLPELARARR